MHLKSGGVFVSSSSIFLLKSFVFSIMYRLHLFVLYAVTVMKIWPMNEYVDVLKNESYWADDEVKVPEVKNQNSWPMQISNLRPSRY